MLDLETDVVFPPLYQTFCAYTQNMIVSKFKNMMINNIRNVKD